MSPPQYPHGHWRKYGRDHWRGCNCTACAMSYEQHQARPTCYAGTQQRCDSCYAHEEIVIKPLRIQKKEENTMSTIHMCERTGCESLMKKNALITIYFQDENGDEVSKDLCPGCMEDLYEVLDAAPLTTRQKAYNKPYKRVSEVPGELAGLTTEQIAAELFQRTMRDARDAQRTIEGGKSNG